MTLYEEVLDEEEDDEEETEELTEEIPEENEIADTSTEIELDPTSQLLIDDLINKIIMFAEELADTKLFPYQIPLARRIIESLLINDGEEITALFSRQSGKTEVLSDIVAACMILFPKLAPMFPDLLGKFKNGLWVGVFAPIEEQALTLHGRIITRLTSDRAMDIMLDPEIDDAPVGGGKFIRLRNSGSFARMQTANPRAKIESKSYHLVLIDEAQGADEYVVRKSIHPMVAFYNGTFVKTGTPDVTKGDFFKAIQLNKRRQTKRGSRQNHFQASWRECAKYNPNYGRFIAKEIVRIGEDSDEFRLSYNIEWLLERGMFTTSTRLDELGDKSMQRVIAWHRSPVLVGIDPARKTDSTVCTVVWVDWDNPDEFGFLDHRILNWLELHGDDWEEQYFQIVDFLGNYNILGIGVDSQGVGDAVAQRLERLIPHAEVHSLSSTRPEQSKRWKHLMELLGRGMISWPSHAKTARLKVYKRFRQQMEDLEKQYEGPYLLAAAPEEAEAHDDYPDSLALACVLTKDMTLPEVEVTNSPFYSRSR